jgi:hypothetical protein
LFKHRVTSCSDALYYLKVTYLYHLGWSNSPDRLELDDFPSEHGHGFIELKVVVAKVVHLADSTPVFDLVGIKLWVFYVVDTLLRISFSKRRMFGSTNARRHLPSMLVMGTDSFLPL